MPGVGELEERVDELETTTVFDDSDLVEEIENLDFEVGYLDERVTALEIGGIAEIPDISMPDDLPADIIESPDPVELTPVELTLEDIVGLQDSMDVMKAEFSDSITVLDESLAGLLLSVDSLSLANDSLKIQLDDLQDQMASLSSTVQNIQSTGTSSSSSRGSGTSGTGTGSSGGRGSTSGTGGGSSGGSTGR